MHRTYNFSSGRTVFRPSRTGPITTEITFFRTSANPFSNRQTSSFDNDERFSIGRPRWNDEEPDTSSTRNPHQTQPLSQFELTGIPEPDFSHVPWRPDRTVSPDDEYEFYLRQRGSGYNSNNYYDDDYDDYLANAPVQRHFRGRLQRQSSTSNYSSRTQTYSSSIRGVVNARTLRPNYPSISLTSTSPRSRTIRVSVSTSSTTTTAKKKEEKPKPTVKLTHRKIEQKDVDAEQSCSICLEPFKKDEKVAVLKCNHFFHDACIKPWIEDHFTCPICRADITEEKKEKKKK